MTELAEIIGEQNLTWPDGPWIDSVPGKEHPAVTLGRQILEATLDGADPEALGGWRGVIDQLDLLVMGAVAARVQATKEVGELKVKLGLNPVDILREHAVIRRAGDAAAAIGLERRHATDLESALIRKAHGQYDDARRGAST